MNEAYIKKHLTYKPEHVVRKHFDAWQASVSPTPVEVEEVSVEVETLPTEAGGSPEELISYEDFVNGWAERCKFVGCEFTDIDGTVYMVSATAQDMWGLSAISQYIAQGCSTLFKFDNGSEVLLSPTNYQLFSDVWVPFRQSFFDGEGGEV